MLAKKYQRQASAKKNLTNIDHKNPNQRQPKNSHDQRWSKAPSWCRSKNTTDEHWLKTLANLNKKITPPKIDQKHYWTMLTENALTDVSWKIVLVDVGLKILEPMLVISAMHTLFLDWNHITIISFSYLLLLILC